MTELQLEELILTIDQFVEELEEEYSIEDIRNALIDYVDLIDEVL